MAGTKISRQPIVDTPNGDDVLLGNVVDGGSQTTSLFKIEDILNSYTIPPGNAPASATASVPVGSISFDSNYVYIATAENVSKRTPINTWPTGRAYTVSNFSGKRTFDASSYTIDDLVQLLCQLIVDLKSLKYVE